VRAPLRLIHSPVVPFAVSVTRAHRWCRVALDGDLDLAAAPELELELRRLERRGAVLLVLDLRGVTFMDLSGMRVLLRAAERARSGAREVAIAQSPSCVRRLLKLAGVDSLLREVEDPDRVRTGPPLAALPAFPLAPRR
jgi:anti-sigma B factor antagonist